MTKIEVYNNSDGSDMIEAVSLEEVAKVIDEIENQIISTVFTRCKIYSKNCFHCKFWKRFDESKQELGLMPNHSQRKKEEDIRECKSEVVDNHADIDKPSATKKENEKNDIK